MALARKLIEEVEKRKNLVPVLKCLIRVREGSIVGAAALSRLLDMCGVRPTEIYMAQVMAEKFGSMQVRHRPKAKGNLGRHIRGWGSVQLRSGGLQTARRAISDKIMNRLAREGLPHELSPRAGWQCMSADEAEDTMHKVRLPDDWVSRPNVPNGSTADRALQFIAQANMAPAYYEAMEEYYHRGNDWKQFPAWHKALIWLHITEGCEQTEYMIRTKGAVSKAQAGSALQLHRARAGLRPRR